MSTSVVDDVNLLPAVRELMRAMDALDEVGASQGECSGASAAWGTSGLCADKPSEDDISQLARLHHRLSAQIGRLIRGPVTVEPLDLRRMAGPLCDYDSPGSERSQAPSPSPQSESHRDGSDPDPGESQGDRPDTNGTDHARETLPFGAQSTLVAAAWSAGRARAVIQASRFVERFQVLDRLWRAGEISTEMILEIQRVSRKLTAEECEPFVNTVAEYLPGLTYAQLRRLCERVLEMVRDDDADDEEDKSYRERSIVFSSFGGVVLFEGRLPKLEGQLFMDAIKAISESQRAQGELLSPGQRNADALIQMVAQAAQSGELPSLGGLPVSVSLTMTAEQAARAAGRDPSASRPSARSRWSFPRDGRKAEGASCRRGYLDDSEDDCVLPPVYPDGSLAAWSVARMALCGGRVTPMVVTGTSSRGVGGNSTAGGFWSRVGLSPVLPLAVGRSQRLATAAQRKALAVRDGGCVIPGCECPPNQTQPHHVLDYSLGGETDTDNLASLCWVHHRQVELGHWTLSRNPDYPAGEGPSTMGTPSPQQTGARPGTPEPGGGEDPDGSPFDRRFWIARPVHGPRRR